MTSALFLLRCVEIGLTMDDLNYLDVGMIVDMFIENSNDNCEYAEIATQDDFKRF